MNSENTANSALQELETKLSTAYWLALIGGVLLLLSLVAHWFASPGKNNVSLFMLIAPLLLLLPGMARGYTRAMIWMGFFLLFYFCKGVVDIFGSPHTLIAWAETLATLATFAGAIQYVKCKHRIAKVHDPD